MTICDRCPDPAQSTLTTASGVACFCGHCSDCVMLITLQWDELSEALGNE